jgi:hypothetical protein
MGEEDHSLGWPQHKCDTLFKKYLKQKRTWGVAQVVKCLPHKYKVLSSNPNATKKKKVQREERNFLGDWKTLPIDDKEKAEPLHSFFCFLSYHKRGTEV